MEALCTVILIPPRFRRTHAVLEFTQGLMLIICVHTDSQGVGYYVEDPS